MPILTFHPGTIEGVSRILADLYSHSEWTGLLRDIPLPGDPSAQSGLPRWQRIANAVISNQNRTQTGNALVAVITAAMRPERTVSRKAAADLAKAQLNQTLALAALKVTDDGRLAKAPKATTDSEAIARSKHLHDELVRRGAHAQVLKYCRAELLAQDFYTAVFEANKGLGTRLQTMGGVDLDGHKLVDHVLCGKEPRYLLNAYRTDTDRNEQLGTANLAKGVFSAFRNPAAHEPRIHWSMTELDALDVFGTLSLIHRRLDGARKSPAAQP